MADSIPTTVPFPPPVPAPRRYGVPAQVPETLVVAGRRFNLSAFPLDSYDWPGGNKTPFGEWGESILRGYLGGWELRFHHLILTGLATRDTPPVAPPGRPPDPVADLLDTLPAVADWFSGYVRASTGEEPGFLATGHESTLAVYLGVAVDRGRVVFTEAYPSAAAWPLPAARELLPHLDAVFGADDAAFIRAAAATPADLTPKLVYADWLQERDDPRAELLRTALSGSGVPPPVPWADELWLRALGAYDPQTVMVPSPIPPTIPPTIPYPPPAADGPTVPHPHPHTHPHDDPDDDHPDPMPDACHYTPLRLHKKGGMGRVFRSHDAEMGREVAVKDIQKRHMSSDELVAKFLFEAAVTAELVHPGVLPVYGQGKSARDRPFYAMRFLDTPPLQDSIARFHAAGPPASLSAEQAVEMRGLLGRFLAACQTIAFAHSRGVIHRDMKPQNVMLGRFGETFVVDWGMAKRIPAAPGITDTGGGTPGYWSPEQKSGAVAAHSEATDVYGLGAVLFAILTGRSPHPTGVHASSPPSPREAAGWVDAALDAICRQSLEIVPADRHPSAAALAAAVERWLADQPAAAQRAVVDALYDQTKSDPADRGLAEQYARQNANLGLMLSGMGRDEDAAFALLDATGVFAELYAATGKPRFLADQANGLLALAAALRKCGQADQAAASEREATGIFRVLIARHPDEFQANQASVIQTIRREAAPALSRADIDLTLDPGGVASAAPAPPPAGVTRTFAPPPAGGNELSTQDAPEPESAAPAPADGVVMQGYEVVRELGRGGAGRVFLARDTALDRLVAVKQLDAGGPALQARFRRELRVTARLRHPNIIQVYTYGMSSRTGLPFIVMEYVEGDLFATVIRRFHDAGGRPTRADPAFRALVFVLAQVCDALHHAHARGVVHRDPKPANVVVRADGQAVLLDWGLAKLTGAADDPGDPAADGRQVEDLFTTHVGAVMGTPVYMAPEQARGDVGVDARSDVHAVGVCLFEVLTGTRPFADLGMVDLLMAKLTTPVPSPRAVAPGVPAALDSVCLRATALAPADRYATAREMAADLRAWMAAPPPGWLARTWGRLAGRPRD